uniref:Uncharacterized protein n=1 Tax=Ascaris lumbricoides TaxID=6252 RepID=A0A0M3HHP7_ASCLU
MKKCYSIILSTFFFPPIYFRFLFVLITNVYIKINYKIKY